MSEGKELFLIPISEVLIGEGKTIVTLEDKDMLMSLAEEWRYKVFKRESVEGTEYYVFTPNYVFKAIQKQIVELKVKGKTVMVKC